MQMDVARERDLYPPLRDWLEKQFRCFKTDSCVGSKYSQVDVFGVRDIGGDFSGDIETIAIEVKNGSQQFATACGQAAGYSVYANRVYLAAVRSEGFDAIEQRIATKLGIGLVEIRGKRITEVLSSPYHQPITSLSFQLLKNIGIAKCQLCGTFFEARTHEVQTDGKKRFSRNFVAGDAKNFRRFLLKAIENQMGMTFWNSELSVRKKLLDEEQKTKGSRRYLCSDCLHLLARIAGIDTLVSETSLC
jgi:hypothetical protein